MTKRRKQPTATPEPSVPNPASAGEAQSAAVDETNAAAPPIRPDDGLDGWGLRVAATVAALLMFPYFITVPPGLQFGDGTELATAAYTLGVPHPTGYPAYMMMLHLWMRAFPVIEPAFEATLFSMVCMAMSAGLGAALFLRLTRHLFPGWSDKAKIVAAVATGLTLGVSRFAWSAAIVTEVYPLQVLLTLGAVTALLRLLDAPTIGRWVVLGVICGLGLAHHRLGVFPALLGVAGGAVMLMRVRPQATLGGWAALILLPALLYLYLPIRANANPPINWGNTRTLSATIHHIRGGDYVGDRFLRPAPGQRFTPATYRQFVLNQSGQNLADAATLWGAPRQNETLVFDRLTQRPFPRPAGPAGWLLAIATVALAGYGLWHILRHPSTRPAALAMAVCAGGSLLTGYLYNIRDIRDYNLVPTILAAILALIGGARLVQTRLLEPREIRPSPAAAWLWALLPAAVFFGNLPEQRQARPLGGEAELLGAVVLNESVEILPANSILITTGDDEIFLAWYNQFVRGHRPDVLVFGGNFIATPWYRGFFSPRQIEDFSIKFADKTAFDPKEFTDQVDGGIIRANIHRRPVLTSSGDPFFLNELAQRYEVRPVLAVPVQLRFDDQPATVTIHRILPRN